MKLVSKRNFIILLASLLIIGFGLMSMYLSQKKYATPGNTANVNTQPEVTKPMTKTDTIDDIEKDLNDTDLNSVDKELQDMETELKNIN